ncbi:hypothetical protein Aph01nite_12980 [Acrocarpospora phusangensis]|uniref:Uncharacterized protein n=1 Tax=Acrocarpospora phusangensis TaxID=1070424 RepID=A0A919Q6S9_9ACTN|nr:hypothetical protein [Acrocarpospora phusangensis]GIH22988.1 hypothetical protein Aph01nite_12980 [Acrocarpospora phusangensis]
MMPQPVQIRRSTPAFRTALGAVLVGLLIYWAVGFVRDSIAWMTLCNANPGAAINATALLGGPSVSECALVRMSQSRS